MFGGQFAGQALIAAGRIVPPRGPLLVEARGAPVQIADGPGPGDGAVVAGSPARARRPGASQVAASSPD